MSEKSGRWAKDEILFRVTVTEFFMSHGKQLTASYNNGEKVKLNEIKMMLYAASRATAGALFNYAVDYCRYHNMRSDNKFKITLFNNNTGNCLKTKIVVGRLTKDEYQAMLHSDYLTFSDENYFREIATPVIEYREKSREDEEYDPMALSQKKRAITQISVQEKKTIAKEFQELDEKAVMTMHAITKATLDDILIEYGEDIVWR